MKHLALIIILAAVSIQYCISQDLNRPKVAVVLSGGGAKGFAHIGVLKVLEDEGIPIDIIVGTSMGSIVGGLYSIGYSADEIAGLSLSQDWAALLSDNIPRKELDEYTRSERQRYLLTIPLTKDIKPGMPSGLINGQNVLNLLCGLTANVPTDADFSKFPVSFACIGADLETGKETVLNSGFLPTAIFSSMAIPGIFVPGEHNGGKYIDGGIVNNFPTDVARKMGADIIIGVDIRTDLHKGSEIKSIIDVMDQLINFYSIEKDSANKTLCTIRIRPNIDGYGTSSFNTAAVDTLIKRGVKSATEAIDEIRELKVRYNLDKREISKALVNQKEWKINEISLSGNYSMSDNLLRDELALNIPEKYSYPDIKRSINNIYGTGNFKRVYFNLAESNDGYCLKINAAEKKTWDVNVGMRANTKNAISVVLNTIRRDYTKTFGLVSFTADISSNPRMNFHLEYDRNNKSAISLSVDGRYNNLNVYVDKDNYYPCELYNASAKLYKDLKITNYAIIGYGIKQEYFNGKLKTIVSDINTTISQSEKHITNLFANLKYDNLDDYYFPAKGTELYSEALLAIDEGFDHYIPIVHFKMRNIIKINKSFSILLNASGRSIFTETVPLHLGNFVGGNDFELLLDNQLPFYGLPSLWPTGRFTYSGLAGLRVNISKKHYVTIEGNYLMHNDTSHRLDEFSTITGIGLTYAYKSAIGPIKLIAGYSDKYKKPTLSANVGFWF